MGEVAYVHGGIVALATRLSQHVQAVTVKSGLRDKACLVATSSLHLSIAA